MAERRIPRAEDVFSGKSESNIFKNKKAPAPPSGPLPKIGNYQPKSLLAPSPGGPAEEPLRHATARPAEDRQHTQLIMGDKNVPIRIERSQSEEPVAPPRRKRRAPSVPDVGTGDGLVSDNPVFGRSMSNVSNDDASDVDFEEQGGVFDFGLVPNDSSAGFRKNQSLNNISNVSTAGTIDPDYKERVADVDFSAGVGDEPVEPSNKYPLNPEVVEHDGIHYPYIPPPDYDDEEYTFNFEEEKPHVYKEYTGEDFGQYLEDDEDLYYSRQQQMRPGPRPHHGKMPNPRQPRPPERKYKKKRKQAKGPEVSGRNTIRDFNFTDTKIGWGDRTVKSTSAKGRYIKREKERNRMDPRSAFPNQKSQGPSYEDFLLGKTGVADSPNSSDSGVDTGDPAPRPRGHANEGFLPDDQGAKRHSDIFYHSQPKQMRNSFDKSGHKESIWKRLTWRFKKSVNITKYNDR